MVIGNTTLAYNQLVNGSLVEASITAYQSVIGYWFWPIIFIFTIVLVYIKSENPGTVFIVSVIGNVMLYGYLPIAFRPFLYLTLVISLFLVLLKIWGSRD